MNNAQRIVVGCMISITAVGISSILVIHSEESKRIKKRSESDDRLIVARETFISLMDHAREVVEENKFRKIITDNDL